MVTELRILDKNKQTLFDTNADYTIPRYQRAYAWEDKEIVQLIDDIKDIHSSENYYIGSLIVSRVKGKSETFEVVDGQQRLTTLYLLLQYLASEKVLMENVKPTLSFDCRRDSNYTLRNIKDVLEGNKNVLEGNINSEEEKEEQEQSLLNGLKAIRQKFRTDPDLKQNIEGFVSRLQRVILYRIEVPENTDLNRYFEIMNTRSEQLEQHDTLKAKLMGCLNKRKEQDFFSRIWNACSDMTGYVQMHFSPEERKEIFGSDWGEFWLNDWKKSKSLIGITDALENEAELSEIISQDFKINEIDGTLDDTYVRFDSIIDFPHFLLHTLRVFVKRFGVHLKRPLGDLLDDKKLRADFENVMKFGVINDKPIEEQDFVRKFIIHLLHTRYLFDKYIIKREYAGEDSEGKWSLKELQTSGQASKKKAYYVKTKLNNFNEWRRTYEIRNKKCLMIQAALRVSYTSPKVMHWITDLLQWLFEHQDAPAELTEAAEDIAARATKDNFLDGGDYELGVQTPHVVFNFLDYLLWKFEQEKPEKEKSGKKKYEDFTFEFRNSVEHWYPQNPSDDSIIDWEERDIFGNLCLISRSVNSKFSNLSPESKMKSYGPTVEKGSLKLRIMGEIMQNCTSKEWRESRCQEHENEMIDYLRKACERYD